jgi:dTDP-4-amino-4,6-dideoxygalactose transaminase
MDPNLLEEEIQWWKQRGKLPSAVIPTDLYGQSCDIDTIKSICDKDGIPVIVDSAEALGATYKGRAAGRGTEAAVFSFNGNKIITTSGGGLLASDDEEIIKQSRFLATQAREPLPHYEHTTVGYNYRMSNIVAAIGLGQLEVVPDRVARKREIFSIYSSVLSDLPGVAMMPEAGWGRCNRWLTVFSLDPAKSSCSPLKIMQKLESENIESRPVWKPMHLQPVFKQNRFVGSGVSEQLFDTGLCLPSGTAMSDDDVRMVANLVADCIKHGC